MSLILLANREGEILSIQKIEMTVNEGIRNVYQTKTSISPLQ